MTELRHFQVEPTAYEQARLALDSAWKFPVGETSIDPLAIAPKNSNGYALIAIRIVHCEMEPFKSAVEGLLESGAATEITQAQYEAALPQSELPAGGPQ